MINKDEKLSTKIAKDIISKEEDINRYAELDLDFDNILCNEIDDDKTENSEIIDFEDNGIFNNSNSEIIDISSYSNDDMIFSNIELDNIQNIIDVNYSII